MASKRIELRDNNGILVNYIDDIILSASWEWNRIGGCGQCSLNVRENFDGVVAGSFAEDYEIRIYLPSAGTDELWYSGYIDRVVPSISGKDETINILCLGYVNRLKRFIIEDKEYLGNELSEIAKSVIDIYVVPNASVYSTSENYEDTLFSADYLYFNENVYDVINKLSDIAGKREWGVRADKAFFFKKREDKLLRYYNLKEDIVNFQPITDYNPIITKIYLEGGENYKGVFSITNKSSLREEIISNSSIITQSVGQQFARMYLKEKGRRVRSYTAQIPNLSARLEATCPLGRAAVNLKIGVNLKYDIASQLYDAGLKYDGGTESFQIENIRYELKDENLGATLTFGPVPPAISDDIKKLEFQLTNERNI